MKSDIASTIIYLKNKIHKWRNISFLLGFFAIFVTFKSFFFTDNVNTIGDYIAEIEIDNVIFSDSHRSKILNKLATQDNVKAVLININSPGGGIVGSEILFKDLLLISQKKPLVVLMGSIAASGAYMASLASDYVIAHNGTLTGSIGVLMQAPNVSELAKKVGVTIKNYKSSPIKGYPSITEEQNSEYDKIIQSSIDDSQKFFSQLVLERRGSKINKDYINSIFDGRVFTGRQAFKAGLVDKIGFREDAIIYIHSKDPSTKNLPIKKVSIVEEEEKLINKFINMVPLLRDINSSSNLSGKYGIMAISK